MVAFAAFLHLGISQNWLSHATGAPNAINWSFVAMAERNMELHRQHLLQDEEVRGIIELHAYRLFELRGRVAGSETEDWLTAEDEILAALLATDMLGPEDIADAELTGAKPTRDTPTKRKKASGKPASRGPSRQAPAAKAAIANTAPKKKPVPAKLAVRKAKVAKPPKRASEKSALAKTSAEKTASSAG